MHYNRFIKWMHGTSITFKLFLSSIGNAIVFYFAAYLSYLISVSDIVKNSKYGIAIHITIFVLALTLIAFGYRLVIMYFNRYKLEIEKEKETILHCYTLCDRALASKAANLENNFEEEGKFIEIFITSTDEIQKIVNSAYSALEATYGKSSSSSDRIDFEVTFMTRSFVDNYITIPSAANKDARQPRSMLYRKKKPEIYDNTVTASIYRSDSPKIQIISDTSDPSYKEIYSGQKTRIKSSVVYPVLSNKNELLGTIVAHCDKPKFFSSAQEKYWCDFMEIFAKRLSYEMIKLKGLYHLAGKVEEKILKIKFNKPF